MRKPYLDNIRWMTVVLVVVYHVFYMYNAEGVLGGLGKITKLDVQYYDLYLYLVYPWLMMLLFLVSGICARSYLEHHTDREFIKARSRKLLVPSTVGLCVFQFIQGYISMSLGGAFRTGDYPVALLYPILVLSGTGVLWYVQLLWLFSMVLVLIRKVEKDRLWNASARTTMAAILLMTALIWGAAQMLNMPVVVVYRFGLYGVVFLLGYFVFSHDEVTEVLKKWAVPLAAAAVLWGIAFCVNCFGENYAEAPINRSLPFTAYGWFACLAILGGMAKYGDFENGVTRWMGKRSFGLYIFHYLGISFTALMLGKSGNVPPLMVYSLSLAAGFAAGYILNGVISKIPFFRWAVLGIGKEKNSVQG